MRISALIVALRTAPVGVLAQQPPVPAPQLVFDRVTVVDVEQGRLLPDQRVVIAGRRIQAVGGRETVELPKAAHVVDASGKYLIPGLWDMHVHVMGYPDLMYPLFIANGVTGVRDMHPGNSSLDSLRRWREEIAAGTRVGPRSVLTGGFLGGPPAQGGNTDLGYGLIPVATPTRARAVVDSLKAAGAEFIKVRDGLSREVFFAVAAEARRLGIPLAGHPQRSVTLAEASDSGQVTIEHIPGCRKDDTEPQCAELPARFRRNGTWVTPTLVVLRYYFGGVAPARRRFWPDSVHELYPPLRTEEERRADDAVQTHRVARAIRAGVPLLAGTDAQPSFPENTAGYSLHDEITWFVEAGMSPLDALRTATLNPATMLRATDSLGTVAPRKLADLVLLDADPLADIAHLQAIRAVVANGRYFDHAALDSLVAGVAASAKHTP